MHNLDILKEIANRARAKYFEILKSHGNKLGERVSKGAYGHMSSFMDVEVENEIIRFVEENDLPFNIFTEERGWIDRGEKKTLIVDPIDGSNNAEHGLPFFSVSLAITSGSLKDVEIGLVKNIPLNIDYWAIKGQGSFKNGQKMSVAKDETGLYVLYLGRKANEKAYQIARVGKRVRDLGCASLEMITVAEGISDIFYYSFKNGGALRIVDIAASYLIVKEAGGLVLDEKMNELDMKMDFKERKNIIAISSEEMKEAFK